MCGSRPARWLRSSTARSGRGSVLAVAHHYDHRLVTDQVPEVSELIERLRERVEERRRAGTYDEHLEDRLQGHFRRIAAHRPPPFDHRALRTALEEIEKVHFSLDFIKTESELPGGSALHKTVGKVVSRQTAGVLQQISDFAAATRSMLRVIIEVLEHPNSHTHGELVGQVDAIFDRLAAYERTPLEESTVVELSRRIQALEERERRRTFNPWYESARFDDEFRGSREALRHSMADLADEFKGCRNVVDIGCGRGHFLELLAEREVPATGVEVDPALVADCRERGLDVVLDDAIGWLVKADDASLDGLVLLQVAEHLTSQELVELIALAHDKLQPGGKAVIETVNPQSLITFARAFYIDPTHTTPIHPAYLAFLFREAGFATVRHDWRSPVSRDEVLEDLDQGAVADDETLGAVQRNVERLNGLLYGPQDYAVIAVR